jgi:hypothetical protein
MGIYIAKDESLFLISLWRFCNEELHDLSVDRANRGQKTAET